MISWKDKVVLLRGFSDVRVRIWMENKAANDRKFWNGPEDGVASGKGEPSRSYTIPES